MERQTEGAWLLAHSKSLDAASGIGAARLENIAYAGKIGRLYNLLRRNIDGLATPTIDADSVQHIAQVNGIDRSTRERGLQILEDAGRIDIASNGGIAVLGATSLGVLEATSDIFRDGNPTADEKAALQISDSVAGRPEQRAYLAESISDEFGISTAATGSLLDLCRDFALVDEVNHKGNCILFNSNTFRSGEYAVKASYILNGLSPAEQASLREVHERLAQQGALYDGDVIHMLGENLFRRLVSIGYFDRMEVSNNSESVGYIASPNDFQKYGRPFEEDPIDDAKALLASLTYGRTRSEFRRGAISMPVALLKALISGREIGGPYGVQAIGEDYRSLEVRQVVKVREISRGRYRMKLLKKDVGELALAIIRGGSPAEEAVLLDGGAARHFTGPHDVRVATRRANSAADTHFMADALDRLRSGG